MIYKIGDTIDKFLLVTVPVANPYQVLYAYIKKIDQVQRVACSKKLNDIFECIEHGSRTTINKLPSKWSVDVTIEELDLDRIKQFCPSVCDVRYSTKMLEDTELRKN